MVNVSLIARTNTTPTPTLAVSQSEPLWSDGFILGTIVKLLQESPTQTESNGPVLAFQTGMDT